MCAFADQANVRNYYMQFEEQQTQDMIDSKIREFEMRSREALQQQMSTFSGPQRPMLPPAMPPPGAPPPGTMPPPGMPMPPRAGFPPRPGMPPPFMGPPGGPGGMPLPPRGTVAIAVLVVCRPRRLQSCLKLVRTPARDAPPCWFVPVS